MSKQHSNNSISLMSCFNDIFNTVEKACDSLTVSNSNTGDIVGSYTYYPYNTFEEPWPSKRGRRWDDFSYIWTIPFSYTIETPSYPVSNYSLLEDGTSIIEVAVTGFEKEEIIVKREDLTIVIEGKKKKEEEIKKKYVYKQIAERDFSIKFDGSDKWDYEKLTVKMNKGLLTISIPIKEECKPVNKTYKIVE